MQKASYLGRLFNLKTRSEPRRRRVRLASPRSLLAKANSSLSSEVFLYPNHLTLWAQVIWILFKKYLYVEKEMHDITITHYIFFSFGAEPAFGSGIGIRPSL